MEELEGRFADRLILVVIRSKLYVETLINFIFMTYKWRCVLIIQFAFEGYTVHLPDFYADTEYLTKYVKISALKKLQ